MNGLRRQHTIQIRGAREGGLQNVNIDIPLQAISCFWGPSGSGHRALLERVLYAESRAQYMRALSPFQREGVSDVKRVEMDSITGLPPVINYLDEGGKPSVTIAAFLGFETSLVEWITRLGTWRCPECEGVCASFHPAEVELALWKSIGKQRVVLLAPLAAELIDSEGVIWKQLQSVGFVRVRIGGQVVRLEEMGQDWQGKPVEVVIDRLLPSEGGDRRFLEGVRSARSVSGGQTVFLDEQGNVWRFNKDLTCLNCGTILGEIGREELLHGHPASVYLSYGEKRWSDFKKFTIGELLSAVSHPENTREKWLDTLRLLCELGLGYLRIDQRVNTLSHSEWLRLRMASCVEAGMSGIVYLFGGIVSCVEGGLRQKVLEALQALVEQGNTVLAIDRSPEIQREAELFSVFFNGNVKADVASYDGGDEISIPISGRSGQWTVSGEGPWGKIDATLPSGAIINLVGESGSGKTRLLEEVIEPLLRGKGTPYELMWLHGKARVHKTQRPEQEGLLLETLGLNRPLAQIFAQTPAGKERAFPSDFYRLDKVGGRCPTCSGRGSIGMSMEYVEDIESICPTCRGKRFRDEVLGVTYKGQTIGHVLEMTVDQAQPQFSREKRVAERLGWIQNRGFGHLKLGSDLGQLEWSETIRLHWAIGLKGQPNNRDFILADSFSGSLHPMEVNAFFGHFKRVVEGGGTVIVADNHPQIRSLSSAVLQVVKIDGQRQLKLL